MLAPLIVFRIIMIPMSLNASAAYSLVVLAPLIIRGGSIRVNEITDSALNTTHGLATDHWAP